MKRVIGQYTYWGFFLLVCCWPAPNAFGETDPLKALKADNHRKVAREIALQVVDMLPDDIHFRLLGIGPIEEDDGTLVDALTTAVKTKTRYHLIERKDLNKILKEQGVQLSPISDPRRPVEPGKIKGVEGLLMGKIVKMNCSFLFCSMQVFMKLDDVEGGDVKFAETFDAYYLPPSTKYGIAAVVVLILVIFYAKRKRRRKFENDVKLVRQDSDLQQNVQNELKRARDNMNRAHDDLVAANRTDMSVKVRTAREEINNLLFQVEQDPGLHLDAIEKESKGEIKGFGKTMAGLSKNVLAESDKVLRAVRTKNDGAVTSAVADLQKEIKLAANRYYDRKVGTA